ncbi:DNA ligase [Salinivibrio costicola]|uniref:DNA ligase n=1 Tax=Salinivibrio costicola TaxID=51367 RepID=UPI0009896BFC|nr:DNA ligase [Salinivibrio costicola]
MMRYINRLSIGLLFACVLSPAISLSAPSAPALMHGVDGQLASQSYQGFWASEKLDGIRAYWTGTELLTRQGNPIHAPQSFLAALPNVPLDGELWAGRGEFQTVLRTVLDKTPNDSDWQRIGFYVFDLPQHPGPFAERYLALKRLAEQGGDVIQWVEQQPVANDQALADRLAQITDAGGEGLMLHHPESLYLGARVDSLVKLKAYQEVDVSVVGMNPGQGRLTGMMGSLQVQMADGTVFNVGSGFTDQQRQRPPEQGQTIVVRYNGVTDKGIPRFARFIREKVAL